MSKGKDLYKNIKLTNARKPALKTLLGACLEDVNHELYGGIYSQMIFGEAFEEPEADAAGVSGMWLPFGDGTHKLVNGGFLGSHSQVLTDAGVYNRGLPITKTSPHWLLISGC